MQANTRPVIGITIGSLPVIGKTAASHYVTAIEEAGGASVFISPRDMNKADECDGFIFAGGRDLHPSKYRRRTVDESLTDREIIRKYSLKTERMRDEMEMSLADVILQDRRPSLGICRGFQVLNAAAGGGLTPDIPTCLPGSVRHRFSKDDGTPKHPVNVQDGSLIAELIGNGTKIVNTYHHQAIVDSDLAPGFLATAYTSDGVIEAWEAIDYPFLVGVQWHPERIKDSDVYELCRPIFRYLVLAASGR